MNFSPHKEWIYSLSKWPIVHPSAFIHLFIQSFIYPFIYLFIHSFVHLFVHLFLRFSFIRSFIYSFIYPFFHLFFFIHCFLVLFLVFVLVLIFISVYVLQAQALSLTVADAFNVAFEMYEQSRKQKANGTEGIGQQSNVQVVWLIRNSKTSR